MESANPKINELHRIFCESTGRDLRLNMTIERYWAECVMEGLTANDLREVIKARQQAIVKGDRRPASLALRNICGTPEVIVDVLDEAAMLRAYKRKKIIPAAKAAVLKASGRPEWYQKPEQAVGPDEQNAAKPVSWHLDQLRKSCG